MPCRINYWKKAIGAAGLNICVPAPSTHLYRLPQNAACLFFCGSK
jgi:hypothetical protein